MAIEKDVYVSYSQIAVFQDGLDNPLNDWKPQHVLQGFSWRPESVSFKTLQEDGDVSVTIRRVSAFPGVRPDTVRAIKVPFEVPDDGQIEVSSITDGFSIQLTPRKYALYFETGMQMQSEDTWCVFSFVEEDCQAAEIVVCDTELQPAKPLLMNASPAV